MKPGGRNYDLAHAKKGNVYAAKLVRKSKKGALRRGKYVNTLIISNDRCSPSRHQHRQNRARRSLPSDCLALLQNRANFDRSAIPARIMFFCNDSWTDFPSDAVETLKQAFASGIRTSVVKIDGSSYVVDFLRMLQIDLTAGIGRSIAWIDVDGKCFFPEVFSGGDDGRFEAPPLELEIEVKIKGGWDLTDQSKAQSENGPCDESSGSESRRIEHRERIGDVGNQGISRVANEIVSHLPDLNRSEDVAGNLRNLMAGKEITLPLPCPEENQAADENFVNTVQDKEILALPGTEGKEVSSGNLLSTTKENEGSNVNLVNKKENEASNGNSVNSNKGNEGSSGKLMNENKENDGRNGNLVIENKENEGSNGNLVNTKKENEGNNGNLANSNSGANRAPGKRILDFVVNPDENNERDDMLSKRACFTRLPELGTAIGGLSTIQSQGSLGLESVGSFKLVKLAEGNRAHTAVKDLFLAGMRRIDSRTRVSSVYWCSHTSRMGNARLQAFQRNADMMKAARGNANVRYAWHGASSKIVESIVLHGFGHIEARTGAEAYGVGIYLSAEGYSQASASHSGPDADGKFHVVLCRVIMGNMEQINLGSHQYRPSNECFDSGVDNLRDPRLYIVWRNRMNTHIIPEYVVSFRVSEHLGELWRRRRLAQDSCAVPICIGALREITKHSPTPVQAVMPVVHPFPSMYVQGQREERSSLPDLIPSMTFPDLFSAIRGQLPESSIGRLENVYNDCKAGKIRKDALVSVVRSIVGDKLLIAAIHNFRNQASSNNGGR
ncbi:probable inactive poly [ADP-ribose] polymerase SRO1 [Magnolia sinica]|uniref:probable inactive poly [ADP-ribose] polymerase SRO1 n=1 Tax=Magnolia sinica TaxID=86752 RepID=UPI00265B0DF8|nr:probable inactive poly [ADP-ribose] polymerase SRO1 [Magnolia sinica]